MSQPIMTVPEQVETVRQANKLREAGQKKEADALERTIPLPAYLAKVLKEKVGADFLIQGGWNLAEAEEKFGQNWLDN